MTDLTGKVAIVTGGATLIGAKVVEALSTAGFSFRGTLHIDWYRCLGPKTDGLIYISK